jgi:hypothetical protein
MFRAAIILTALAPAGVWHRYIKSVATFADFDSQFPQYGKNCDVFDVAVPDP